MTGLGSDIGTAAAFAYLDGLTGYEQTRHLAHPTTERIAALMAVMGHPEHACPVIHVTGTNGKGSTTAMIAARCATTPSWFEALTAAALWELAEQAVDVAVIEVGMLGRWDATEVVDGSIAVVTNVELDHTDLAGPDRAAIAREKAGIVDGAHNPAAATALRHTVRELGPSQTPRVLVCGALRGRDVLEFLLRVGIADYDLVIATRPASPRALSNGLVARSARALGAACIAIDEPGCAMSEAMNAADASGMVVGTGSLHLLATLRAGVASR